MTKEGRVPSDTPWSLYSRQTTKAPPRAEDLNTRRVVNRLDFANFVAPTPPASTHYLGIPPAYWRGSIRLPYRDSSPTLSGDRYTNYGWTEPTTGAFQFWLGDQSQHLLEDTSGVQTLRFFEHASDLVNVEVLDWGVRAVDESGNVLVEGYGGKAYDLSSDYRWNPAGETAGDDLFRHFNGEWSTDLAAVLEFDSSSFDDAVTNKDDVIYSWFVRVSTSQTPRLPESDVQNPWIVDNVHVLPGLDSMRLLWDEPEDLGGVDLLGYTVRARRTNKTSDWVKRYSGTDTDITIEALGADDTSYGFEIRALSTALEGTPFFVTDSTADEDITVPAAPTNLIGKPHSTKNEIAFLWNVPSGLVNSYIMEYYPGTDPAVAIELIGLEPYNGFIIFTLAGLTWGAEYTTKVRATNAAGEGAWSETYSATVTRDPTQVVPGAITTLTVTRTGNVFSLSWSVPASNTGPSIDGYSLQYFTTVWNIIPHTGTDLTASFTGQPGERYMFRVAGVNSAGTGQYTVVQNQSIPANTPDAPINLSVAVDGESATATWDPPTDDGGADITGYSVQWQDLGGAEGAAWTTETVTCLLYTSPSPRDRTRSRMPSSA